MLKVKEVFGPTIQGEGRQTGLAAIFIRFAGCNMWDGDPEHRAKSGCPFCDTRFDGGEFMTPGQVAERVLELRAGHQPYLVVFTGGEPLLQPVEDLYRLAVLLVDEGFHIQLETNGTQWNPRVRQVFDFITVSPKVAYRRLKIPADQVDCFKLLYPHPAVPFEPFIELSKSSLTERIDYCIQPIEPPSGLKEDWDSNVRNVVRLIKQIGYPWRLSLQTHKILGEA